MKSILNFLIEAGKLKKMPRTGFLWLGIKKPETIAQHAFRVALMNWFLARKTFPKLNIKRVIQISLVHDLCEVYAGDITPYWGLLPEDKKKRREVLKRWIRLPQKIKLKRDRQKFLKEKKSLEKLIKLLPVSVGREIMNVWLSYERMGNLEGKFVKQGDKIETLLQALEYWGTKPNSPVIGWWEEVYELVDHPLLLDFLSKIEKKFYQNKKINGEINFFLEMSKIKKMPRRGWVLRKVKNPETIAEHAFLLTLAVWVLGKMKNINLDKALKMSLIYEIAEVYAGDRTPYDGIINSKNKKEILKRWPRLSKKEKEKQFIIDCKEEKKALKKVIASLPKDLQGEIFFLWEECKESLTPEAKFVNQVYWITTYLQALQYFQEDKNFPILAWYEQMRVYIDNPFLLELLEEMEDKFLAGQKLNFCSFN